MKTDKYPVSPSSALPFPQAFGRTPAFLLAIFSLLTIHSPLATILYAADTGIEFGAADDLSVMGVEGGAVDPDVEIKGFTVFGSTQASYPGAVTGPGNVVVNGYLSVSSGAYFAGISTFPAASGVFIADGNDKEVLSKDGVGPLKWTAVSELGDSLGSHVATTTLNMDDFNMIGVSTISVSSITTAGEGVIFSTSAYFMNGGVGVGTASPLSKFDVLDGSITVRGTDAGFVFEDADRVLSPETDAALGAGVRVSTNVYIVGFSSAAKYFGDGSSLAGAGDDLGDHTAATTLNMGDYAILSSSGITAAEITAGRYLINGSTALALSGTSGSSLGVGVDAGRVNTGDNNIFLGKSAGYSNTTGAGSNFLGRMAGYSNTTGGANNFVGYDAGDANTTGAGNNFLGFYAGYFNTTGGGNNSMGYFAGRYNTTGSANVAFGYRACGYNNMYNYFSSSTIMGYQAGRNLTNTYVHVLVGFNAGYSVTTGTGNIVVGYGKDTSAATANNELNIGGLLYGDLSAKTIGISTRVPQAALDIVSTGTASDIYAQIWRDSGGVIRASMTSEGTLYAAAVSPPTGAAGGVLTGTYPNPGLATAQTAAVSWSGAQTFNGGASFPGQGIWNISGNVGIGTTAPGQLLHLYSAAGDAAARFQTLVSAGGGSGPNNGATFADDDSIGTVEWVSPASAQLSDDDVSEAWPGGASNTHYLKATNFSFTIPGDAVITGIAADVERSDMFGVAKDNIVKLVKGGTISGDDKADTVTSWPTSDAYKTYGGSGDLWGLSWTPADINAADFGFAISVNSGLNMLWIDHIRITVYYTVLSGANWTVGGDNSAGGVFKIAGSDALGPGDYVTINNSGDVGIGTTNPGAKLEVAGQVKITGGSPGAGKTLTSDAAGLASWVTVAGDNLGNHTATTALNMADFNITGVSIIAASSITTALSGVTFSTNVYVMNGNFGIGTTAPGSGLAVISGAATAYSLAVGTSAAYSLVVSTGGDVGIGTTAPGAMLDVAGAIYSRRYAAAADIDWNNGNTQSLTLTAVPTTLTFANGRDGGKYFLILKQDGTGSRTVTWPAEVRFPGGTAPVLTTTAGKTDYVSFIYNGVDSKYDAVAFMKDL